MCCLFRKEKKRRRFCSWYQLLTFCGLFSHGFFSREEFLVAVWNFSLIFRSVDLTSQKNKTFTLIGTNISNMDSGIPGFARWHGGAAVFGGGWTWSMMTRDYVFPWICKPHQNPPKWTHEKQTWSAGGVFYCSMLMFLILTEELQDLDTAMNSMGSMQHSWLLSGVMRYDAIPNNAPRANHSKLSI